MGLRAFEKTRAAGALLLAIVAAAPALHSAAQESSGGVVSAARLEAIWSDVEEEVRLRRHDKDALQLLRNYGIHKDIDKPRRGPNGSIVFPFGATQVRIICAPLRVCDVALEPGEIVTGMHIGDRGRWGILPADVGKGPMATTHVVIKPHAMNLETNLVILPCRRDQRPKWTHLFSLFDGPVQSVFFPFVTGELLGKFPHTITVTVHAGILPLRINVGIHYLDNIQFVPSYPPIEEFFLAGRDSPTCPWDLPSPGIGPRITTRVFRDTV